MKLQRLRRSTIALILAVSALLFSGAASSAAPGPQTSTPIKHLVVIFQENISFDHYFGTYPSALNPQGEPGFQALPNTPSVNGLTPALLTNNPNLANPKRLDRNTPSDVVTCDQDHGYTDEQKAFDQGKMDKFVQIVAGSSCKDKSIVMDYYDGNTVTALWNYAQHFAMSDNSFGSTFGPSTPGALNLISARHMERQHLISLIMSPTVLLLVILVQWRLTTIVPLQALPKLLCPARMWVTC